MHFFAILTTLIIVFMISIDYSLKDHTKLLRTYDKSINFKNVLKFEKTSTGFVRELDFDLLIFQKRL